MTDIFHGHLKRMVATIAMMVGAVSAAWAGDYAVIVNKDNAAAVDKATVAKIYTGEMKQSADGTRVVAVDLPDDSPVRAAFCSEIVGKAVAQIKSAWATLVFSGRALPPKQVATDEEVKKLVSASKGAIGYIGAGSIDGTVRVVIK